MDPLTAFSLACGVIQVVDYSTRVVSACREIYKDGVSSENNELEELAGHMKSLRSTLTTLNQSGESKPLFGDDDNLHALAIECCETADELTDELATLKPIGPHKKPQAVKKTFKAFGKKDVIGGIQRKLDRQRSMLETHILVNLRFVHLRPEPRGD